MTFATKYVNRALLGYDPQGRTRLRFSLMPEKMSRLVDVRTSPIAERIGAIDDFVEAGYEVNLNFGPVIYAEGWLDEYARLFDRIDQTISAKAKVQLQAEVIFLTHNAPLHEVNLRWHSKAEEVLWRPDLQENKISGTGGENVRYKLSIKHKMAADFRALLKSHCRTAKSAMPSKFSI